MIAQGRTAQQKSKLQNHNSTVFVIKCEKKGKLNIKIDFNDVCLSHQYQHSASQSNTNPFDLLPQFIVENEPSLKAFCLPSNKAALKLENQAIFQRLAAKNTLENSNINDIMRPKPTATYCQVCRQHFDDYLQHIQHQSHKKRIGQSIKSSRMISELISNIKYQPKRPRSEKILKTSGEDQFNNFNKIQSSSKIRVIQSENTLTPLRIQKEKREQIQDCSIALPAVQLNNNKVNNPSFFKNNILLLQ